MKKLSPQSEAILDWSRKHGELKQSSGKQTLNKSVSFSHDLINQNILGIMRIIEISIAQDNKPNHVP